LWSTWQPPGQRIEDKVAWAKELLALYDPNIDLEHSNVTSVGEGGNCLTCAVKWPCPTEVRRTNTKT